MFRKSQILVLGGLLLAGCTATSDGNTPDQNDPPGTDGGPPAGSDAGPPRGEDGGPGGSAESVKANVRFKRNERLRNDFGQALGLPVGQVCLELGQYDCADFVHKVALGGVEPYVLGLNEPLGVTTVTTPIAVERLAFFGCERRVSDDFAGPGSAVIFANLTVDGEGKLADPEGAAVAQAIDALYKRAVQRPAKQSEIDDLMELYRDIEADGQPDAARDWAILGCVSVLTTMESLFY